MCFMVMVGFDSSADPKMPENSVINKTHASWWRGSLMMSISIHITWIGSASLPKHIIDWWPLCYCFMIICTYSKTSWLVILAQIWFKEHLEASHKQCGHHIHLTWVQSCIYEVYPCTRSCPYKYQGPVDNYQVARLNISWYIFQIFMK